jgi:hypothetical protein
MIDIKVGSTITIDGKDYVVDSFEPNTHGSFTISGRVKERWWFDPRQEEERVMCCARKPDTNYVEVTPEYVEYLRNKPVERCVIKIPEQGDTYLALSGGWNTKPTNAKFGENEKEPYRWCKTKSGWRVYDVIANKGKYYVKDLGSCGGDVFLPNAIGRVGFGGVQFEGSPSEWWGMNINAYIDSEGMPYSQSFCDGLGLAVPIRARFWENGQ